jgi:hypothetical protein
VKTSALRAWHSAATSNLPTAGTPVMSGKPPGTARLPTDFPPIDFSPPGCPLRQLGLTVHGRAYVSQVIASDVAVTMGRNEGNFELNAFRPILIANYLHSALIMADMCDHFRQFMVEGTTLNQAKPKENIDRSVMMVTALSPVIGYDRVSLIFPRQSQEPAGARGFKACSADDRHGRRTRISGRSGCPNMTDQPSDHPYRFGRYQIQELTISCGLCKV